MSFEYPAPFIGTDEDGGGVLSIKAAGWFASILSSIPGLEVDLDLCQEDWGVVIFTKRNERRFDINFWDGLDEEPARRWIAQVDYGGFFGKYRSGARQELSRLALDLHEMLTTNPQVSRIVWFDDLQDAWKPQSASFPRPE